jgi:hypothetical protein
VAGMGAGMARRWWRCRVRGRSLLRDGPETGTGTGILNDQRQAAAQQRNATTRAQPAFSASATGIANSTSPRLPRPLRFRSRTRVIYIRLRRRGGRRIGGTIRRVKRGSGRESGREIGRGRRRRGGIRGRGGRV